MLAFAMANTNSAHPCMNHGKCKLKITVFPMGNANLRFFVFAMANTHLKMHLPWQIQTKKTMLPSAELTPRRPLEALSRKDGRENDRDVIDETCALLAGKNVPIDYFLG